MPDKNHQAVNTVVNFIRTSAVFLSIQTLLNQKSDVAVLNKPDLFDNLNKDVHMKI